MPKKTAKGNGWANRIEYRCTGRLRRQWRRHRYDESNLEVAKLIKLQVVTSTYGYVRHVFPSPAACCSPRAHARSHLLSTLPPFDLADATCFQLPVPRPSASPVSPPPSPPSRLERTAAGKASNSQGSILFFIGVKTPPPHTDRNKSCPFPEEEIPPACAASRRYRPWDCVSWTSTLFSKRLAPPCFGDLLPWSSQLE